MWAGVREEIKICGGGVAEKKYAGGVSEKKYARGVGEKIKICEGGSAKKIKYVRGGRPLVQNHMSHIFSAQPEPLSLLETT